MAFHEALIAAAEHEKEVGIIQFVIYGDLKGGGKRGVGERRKGKLIENQHKALAHFPTLPGYKREGASPRFKANRILGHFEAGENSSAEILEIEGRALLLRREEQALLSSAEALHKGRLPHPTPSVEHQHLEYVLSIEPIECLKFRLSPNEHPSRQSSKSYSRVSYSRVRLLARAEVLLGDDEEDRKYRGPRLHRSSMEAAALEATLLPVFVVIAGPPPGMLVTFF